MNQVLIHKQTPTRIIYNDVEYKSLCSFATKHKFYDNRKRKLLLKFIWRNFKDIKKDNVYNIDSADGYLKSKLQAYLKGKTCKKSIATQVIFKGILYPSIFSLSNQIGLCKAEVLRAINMDKNYKKGIQIINLSKKTENLIDKKIEFKHLKKRRDSIKIIYSNEFKDYIFNSVNELARKIKVNKATIKSYMYKNKIKAENYEIDLNKKKYSKFRCYIEKKDILKELIPFKNKVKEFAKATGVSLNKIQILIESRSIKTIKELQKYYTNY